MAKVKKLGNYMIELIQYGSSFDEAQAHAHGVGRRALDTLHLAVQQLRRDRRSVDGVRRDTPPGARTRAPRDLGRWRRTTLRGAHLARRARTLGHSCHRRATKESAALYHVLRGATMAEVVHRPTIADGLAGGGDDGSVTNDLIASHDVPARPGARDRDSPRRARSCREQRHRDRRVRPPRPTPRSRMISSTTRRRELDSSPADATSRSNCSLEICTNHWPDGRA